MLKGKINDSSLFLSVEFSFKLLNEKYEKAVDLFYMIGITEEGLFENDIN